VQLELTIMTQAPRMAHTLRYHQTSNSQLSKLKTFWVVYYFDKMANFAEGVSSVGSPVASAVLIFCFD